MGPPVGRCSRASREASTRSAVRSGRVGGETRSRRRSPNSSACVGGLGLGSVPAPSGRDGNRLGRHGGCACARSSRSRRGPRVGSDTGYTVSRASSPNRMPSWSAQCETEGLAGRPLPPARGGGRGDGRDGRVYSGPPPTPPPRWTSPAMRPAPAAAAGSSKPAARGRAAGGGREPACSSPSCYLAGRSSPAPRSSAPTTGWRERARPGRCGQRSTGTGTEGAGGDATPWRGLLTRK